MIAFLTAHVVYLIVRAMKLVADGVWTFGQWLYQTADRLYDWALDRWYDHLERTEEAWEKGGER